MKNPTYFANKSLGFFDINKIITQYKNQLDERVKILEQRLNEINS